MSDSKPPFNFAKWIVYILLRVLAWTGNLFSPRAADSAAKFVGKMLYILMPKRRQVALNNLDIAFGDTKTQEEKRVIAEKAFQHISISIMEMFRISHFVKQGLERTFTVYGLEHFENALAKKKGLIFLVSHIGSWEYLAFLFHLTGYRCSALVKKLRNYYIFNWLSELRRQTTLNVIHKKDARHALRTMMRELAHNDIVAILMDQWAGNEEPWVEFFGKPASTTSIPARIALKTGCALVPGACIRKAPGKYEITLLPEIEVDQDKDDRLSVTRRINQSLEAQIRMNPEQWTWTHKRWKNRKVYR